MINYNNIVSSHQWYKDEGHTVPSITIYGPYDIGLDDGETYTNLEIQTSNWDGLPVRRVQGTFSHDDMVALRDALIDLFPPTDEEELPIEEDDFEAWLNSDYGDEQADEICKAEDERVLNRILASETVEDEDDEEAEQYYLEQDPFTEDWVVYELEYKELASFRHFSHADSYIEALERGAARAEAEEAND